MQRLEYKVTSSSDSTGFDFALGFGATVFDIAFGFVCTGFAATSSWKTEIKIMELLN